MAGIHADHTVHRVVSGEAPVVGLRVLTNELRWGTIVEVATDEGCGYYCNAWHKIKYDGTTHTYSITMNCDRLSTKLPSAY